jgi:hypothetical protein
MNECVGEKNSYVTKVAIVTRITANDFVAVKRTHSLAGGFLLTNSSRSGRIDDRRTDTSQNRAHSAVN